MKHGFQKKTLIVERQNDYIVKLLEPLKFYTGECIIMVPKGFKTDYASIPKWLQWLISPIEKYVWRASILHDYLYSNKKYNSRRFCDNIFIYAMKCDGCDIVTRNIRWIGVRLFGKSHFNI